MYEASVPVTKLPTQCPLCLDTYSRPLALPCLHSFCSDCLYSYVTSAQTISSISPFPCPVCRLPTKPPRPYVPRSEWSAQFPLNHVIVSLLDEARTQRRPLHGVPLCSMHAETEENMYCGDHDEICCPRCIALHHRTCEQVSDIDHLVQTMNIDTKIEEFIDYTKDMDNHVTDIEAKCTLAQSKLDIESDRIKDSISSEKYRLLEHLDNMETEAHDRVDEMARAVKGRIDEEKQFAISGKTLCSQTLHDMRAVNEGTVNPTIKYATLHKHMKTLHGRFTDTPRPDISGEVRFDFKPNSYFSDEAICTAGSLGSVSITVHEEDVDDDPQDEVIAAGTNGSKIHTDSQRPAENCLVIKATNQIAEERCDSVSYSRTEPMVSMRPQLSLFPARSNLHLAHSVTGFKFLCFLDNPGKKRQWVSGSAFLHDKMAILCSQTGSLLAIHRDNKTAYEEIQQTPPWNVARVNDTRIAVTYPQERLVRLFSVHCSSTVLKLFKKPTIITNPLVEHRYYSVEDPCYGIALLGNNLITACEDCVKVFNPTGRCLQTLKPGAQDATHNEFRRIQAIAVDPFRHSVYLSDEANHAVMSFQCNYQRSRVHDQPTFVFSHDHLRSPQGLAANSTGEVYVCGFVSKNIHVISPSGESLKVFPMLQRPYSISVDAAYGQAIVTFYPESDLDHCSPVIHMYKLNP